MALPVSDEVDAHKTEKTAKKKMARHSAPQISAATATARERQREERLARKRQVKQEPDEGQTAHGDELGEGLAEELGDHLAKEFRDEPAKGPGERRGNRSYHRQLAAG